MNYDIYIVQENDHVKVVKPFNGTTDWNMDIGALLLRYRITITSNVHLMPGVKIYPGAIIGTDAEHITKPSKGYVFINNDTVIRENVVIHRGTSKKEISTYIGRNCYIMNKSYIAHDCYIGDNCRLSAGVSLGGHSKIMSNTNMGINSSTHQYTTIANYCMVGMGSVVIKDLEPFSKVVGVPAKIIGLNDHDKSINPDLQTFTELHEKFHLFRRTIRDKNGQKNILQ